MTPKIHADLQLVSDRAGSPVEQLLGLVPWSSFHALRDAGLVALTLAAWTTDSSGRQRRLTYATLTEAGEKVLASLS